MSFTVRLGESDLSANPLVLFLAAADFDADADFDRTADVRAADRRITGLRAAFARAGFDFFFMAMFISFEQIDR